MKKKYRAHPLGIFFAGGCFHGEAFGERRQDKRPFVYKLIRRRKAVDNTEECCM